MALHPYDLYDVRSLLSEEERAVQDTVSRFTDERVLPIIGECFDAGRFPAELVPEIAELGLLGATLPAEYGGSGGSNQLYSMCVEELSKVCATTGVIVSAHTSLGSEPIRKFGTPEQIQKYLIPLAKGEKLGAFGLTEPNAGTDASGQQTKAVLEGDHYVLNGSKIFITNGGKADIYIGINRIEAAGGSFYCAAVI